MRMVMVLVVLTACGGNGQGPDFPDGGGLVSCGANKVQDLLGQPISGLRARFPDSARIIPPGAAITEDYNPDRLNVDLDGVGSIKRIWCG